MKKVIIGIAATLCGLLTATQCKAEQVVKVPSAVQGLKVKKVTEKSLELKWRSVKNASGYVVFQYNTKAKKFKKIKNTKKTTYKVKKGLKRNKASQFMVQAYENTAAGKQYSAFSKTVSAYLSGSRKQNVKKVNFMYKTLTVEEGALFKPDTELTPDKKVASKKVDFVSSNPSVAQVLENGVIRANKRGKANITAIAHNGVSCKISIWVLEKQYSPEVHKIKSIEKLQLKALDNSSLKINWEKCGHVEGYNVFVYDSRTGECILKKIVKGKTKTSTVISDLKQNVKYTIIVKGFKNKKGVHVYGANSRKVSGCVLGGSYVNASSIRFGKNEYEVMEGEKLKLDCFLEPANIISSEICYTSSKPEVATVAADGTVTGHDLGKTYITAYSHNGLSVRVPVRVIENSKYADKMSVLCFHRVVSDSLKKSKFATYEWVAALSDFERQMKYLYDNHYTTLTLDELYDWYKGKRKVPAKTVVLTFDDGDYEFYHLVYPVLKKYNFKATMFVVGTNTKDTTEEYKDEETRHYLGWDKINEMKKNYPNISFQSHTFNMHYARKQIAVYELSLAQIYQDFETNRLSGIANNNDYQYIAYPYGGFNDDVVYCAKKYKFKLAFDFGIGRKVTRDDSIYHIPRMKINGQITMENFKKRI